MIVCGLLISCIMSDVSAETADKTKVINVEADTIVVNDISGVSTYSGNVVFTQGSLIVRAAKVVVAEDNNSGQQITAYGSAKHPTTFILLT